MAELTRIQFFRGTASQWASANPVLAQGQPGYEIDTGKLKIGNGSTDWNSLPYSTDPTYLANLLDIGTGYTVVTDNNDIVSAIAEVDSALAALSTGFVFKGDWDASAGAFPSGANTGYTYKVTGAGTVDGVDFQVGDTIYAIANNASTTTYAGNWVKVDSTDAVTSVFGRTGAVTAQAGDYNASQITNTPAGNITATDVQGAINELDTNKQEDVITSQGSLVLGNASGNASELTIGSNGTFLKSDGATASWSNIIDGGTVV